MWAPTLWWQATNGWPQATLAHEIHEEYSEVGNRIGFFAEQLLPVRTRGHVALDLGRRAPVARPRRVPRAPPDLARVPDRLRRHGWAGLLHRRHLPGPHRSRGGSCLGTPSTPSGARPGRCHPRSHRGAAAVPAAALRHRPLQQSSYRGPAENQFETVGWPDLVDQVAETYDALPASQRATTRSSTSNYGEAGAISRVQGRSNGLPAAYSGHNGFGDWGPPPERDTSVIAISEGGPPRLLRQCQRVAAVHNRDGVSNEETENAAIYVCEAPAQGWAAAWPHLRHLDS